MLMKFLKILIKILITEVNFLKTKFIKEINTLTVYKLTREI